MVNDLIGTRDVIGCEDVSEDRLCKFCLSSDRCQHEIEAKCVSQSKMAA